MKLQQVIPVTYITPNNRARSKPVDIPRFDFQFHILIHISTPVRLILLVSGHLNAALFNNLITLIVSMILLSSDDYHHV